jgi:ATP-dependent Clp protease ATP-binding subunit ClpA
MTGRLWERSRSRLSASCRSIESRAQGEARQRDDNHVGTEHIVLALISQTNGSAASALAALHLGREDFVSVLDDEEGVSPDGTIPMTPRARRILELAVGEADRLGDETIRTFHVLLGVVDESLKWRQPGPHHLRTAGERLGFTLEDVREMALGCRGASEP